MKTLLLHILLILSFFVKGQLADFNHINFSKADSTAKFHQGASLSNIPGLAHKLTYGLSTDVERFKSIFLWVSANLKNDDGLYNECKSNRAYLYNKEAKLNAWNEEFKTKVFEKLICEKKTICTGYAYLVQELARFVNIQCVIVDGYARNPSSNAEALGIPNHSWNAVKLNNKWYLCDATWASGKVFFDRGITYFESTYNAGYFLSVPALFVKNHYPLDTNWSLLKNCPSKEDFVSGPMLYGGAFQYNLMPVSPNNIKLFYAKHDSIIIVFQTSETVPIDSIHLELDNGYTSRNEIPRIKRLSQNKLEVKYTFVKTGYYALHIKIANEIIATYTVDVSRKLRFPKN